MWAAMCSICAVVASAFMTTITVDRPPSQGRRCSVEHQPIRIGMIRKGTSSKNRRNAPAFTTRKRNKPRDLAGGRSRGWDVGFEKLSRELWRHSVLGPATCRGTGKRPGPPPATVKKQTVDARVGRDKECNSLRQSDPRPEIFAAREPARPRLEGPDLADPDRKAMVKSAAARRATRRLPLGEPPLVITTHAITSFRYRLPGPAGDQPRAGNGL